MAGALAGPGAYALGSPEDGDNGRPTRASKKPGPAAAASRSPVTRVRLPGPADAPAVVKSVKAPAAPADFKSAHFLVHTDLPAKEARELLARLETMLSIISTYWNHPPVGVIECYVVGDLDCWPAGSLAPRVGPRSSRGPA